MRFRDGAELRVYRALKRAAHELPTGERILIAPNPAVRVADHTWEPDFLVTPRGRCGLIEVDGHSHRGRAASDKSRDRLYEDAGVAYVDRMAVEDTQDEGVLDDFISRFLRKLAYA